MVASYSMLPLSFKANQRQVSGALKFLSTGPGYALLLSGDEAVLKILGGLLFGIRTSKSRE
jgi:hypothetical protein